MSLFSFRKTRNKSLRPIIETLEARIALDATAWSSFGGNAQHTSISSVASQPLEAVHWSTKVDNFPTSRAAHYGGPLITLNNTVIYPYKTGNTQSVNTPDYRIVARNGVSGALVWDIPTPYIPASYSWYPLNQPVLATATNRVYFTGKGGTIYYRDNPDSSTGTVTQLAFFGSIAHYQANQAAYDNNVFIDTPLTADNAGNIYFGFRVIGSTPTGLSSGIARISANGTVSQAAGSWVSAFQAAGGTDSLIGAVQMNGAPAISNDGTTLYIVVKQTGNWVYRGRLVGLDTTTLATKYNSGVLKDPRGADAAILNDSTSSPMVAPDGRVFLGVFGNPYNGSRGWMLQFSGDLQTKYTPGGFGWDTTPSIVPASMLGSQYTGTSPYLIFTKYNDYYFANGANDGGSGQNLIAVLDPNATEVEHHHPEQNILVMKRVLTKLGPTADWDYPNVPTAVREWCINYGAVDPATNSIIVNSSDGKFYRWHLPTNSLIEPLALTSGIGQPYTPTVIGVDGSTYGIQNGSLFALGQTPRISVNDITVVEGTGGTTNATFVVSLNYPRREAITVHWATQGDTALPGDDYTAGSGTLTFAPGVMSQTITVAINPDALNEAPETFFVNLDSPTNAVLATSRATATISDDDAIPKLSITDVAISEGNSGSNPYTLFSFAVTLNAPSGRTVSVQGTTQDQSASSQSGASQDFIAWTGGLTFAPGETSKLITVQVIGDTTFENNETFQVKLLSSTHATLEDDTGIGSIINDDDVPSLSIDSVPFTEGSTQSFTVSLSNASAQPITVVYATSNGTAGSSDYVSGTGTLTFAPGVLSQTVPIQTLDDNLNELSENFFVQLSQPTNAFIAKDKGEGTIIDNDAMPSVSVRGFTANEGQTGTTLFQFEVELSVVSGRDVFVNYATADGTATVAGNDYQAATGTIHFLPGQRTQSIQVAVQGDNLNEADETFLVQLVSSDGSTMGTAVATGTITNDDALVLAINDPSIVEGDSGVSIMVFTVTMSSQSSLPVTVDFATADETAKQADGDYETATGRLTFAPGETQKTLEVRILGDLRNEANETILVRLSNSVGGAIGDSEGQGIIQDDDPMPSLSVGDISFPEMDYNTGTVNLYVQLSSPSGQTVTVDYRTENGTATSTSNIKDYIDTFGTITFLPGETVQSVQVSIVGDLRVEPDETVRFLLSNPVNATISDDLAILNIVNDDRAMVTITGASVIEGDSGTKIAQVDVSLSNPSDSRITIDFGSYDGSAVAGLDYVSQTGTLVFEPGEMVKKIDYQIIGDNLDEPDEDFEVYLSNGTGPVYLPYYSETDIDIIDDDLPEAIYLSSLSIPENSGINAVVGTFNTSSTDPDETFTYTLVSGAGSADNSAFNIDANTLRANNSFDFEAKSNYTIRVRTTDQGGFWKEQSFSITVIDVVEGTAGNDTILATYTGDGTSHAWMIKVNAGIPFSASGSLIVDGFGGSDTLQITGRNVSDFFELAANQVTLNGSVVRFAGTETLKILGGDGNDELTVTANAPPGLSRSFDGGLGTDAVKAVEGTNTWNVTGAGASNLGSPANLLMTRTESLIGGSGDDQFVFAVTGSLTGRVLGGAGNDTLNFAAKTTAHNVNLQASTSTSTGGIGGIESFIGSSTATVTDVLIGANSNTNWTMSGANTGTLSSSATGSISFAGFESLTGGTAADTFTFAATGSLSKSLTGGSATGAVDSVDLSAKTAALNFQLNTTNSLPGTIGTYAGIEQITGNSVSGSKVSRVNNVATAWTVNASGQIVVGGVTYSGVSMIEGNPGSAADTLTGPAVAATWNVNSANGGTLTIPGSTVSFIGIENVTGSTGIDTFVFGSSGSLSGNLNGGGSTGGADSVNLSAKSGALDFQLNTTNSLPGTIGTYTGIEQITGNSVSGSKVTRVNNVATAWTVNASGQIVVGGVTYTGVGGIAGGPGTDTLTGPGVDSTWTINAANGGALAIPGTTIGFTAIESLTGGTASDSFAMLPGGSLTGNLNGGTGTAINSLSYETRTTGVTVNLSVNTAANATSIAGLTSNIQMVTGGSGNDVLTGQTSKATILIGLAGNDTLIGGSQRDMLFGGAGADILQAGSGDDLLISGTTAFDTNRVAILQLYAEWTSTRTFAQRTANIWGNGTGTRSNGSTFLNNDSADGITDTVFGDSDVDSLTGGLGQDWFLALASEVTDLLTSGTTPDRRNG